MRHSPVAVEILNMAIAIAMMVVAVMVVIPLILVTLISFESYGLCLALASFHSGPLLSQLSSFRQCFHFRQRFESAIESLNDMRGFRECRAFMDCLGDYFEHGFTSLGWGLLRSLIFRSAWIVN